jgi:hypothetical protein
MSLDALAGRMVANMINATERLHQMMAPNVWKAAPELLAVPLVLLASRLQVGGPACVQLLHRCWEPAFQSSSCSGHAVFLLAQVLESFPDAQVGVVGLLVARAGSCSSHCQQPRCP